MQLLKAALPSQEGTFRGAINSCDRMAQSFQKATAVRRMPWSYPQVAPKAQVPSPIDVAKLTTISSDMEMGLLRVSRKLNGLMDESR